MRKPELKSVDVEGITLRVLPEPPPHLVFLSSQIDAEKDSTDSLVLLARMGGLAALVVRELDGEEVLYAAGRPPRTMAELESTGRGFVMAAFERVGSYEALSELFAAILAVYQESSANPT